MEKKFKLYKFLEKGDDRGHLVILEAGTSVPFNIKRVFYSFDSKNEVSRGKHANRNTKFMLVSVKGSCTVDVCTGKAQATFVLDSPSKGLFIDSFVWKEMRSFSNDNILLCLCSEHYDPNEYIFDYNEFLVEINEN